MAIFLLTMFVKPVFMIMTRYIWKQRKWITKIVFDIFYAISKRWMKQRRVLWITTFLIIFIHAGLWIIQWLRIDFSLWSQLQVFSTLAGYIGLLMLFAGYITSNNYSIRLLKKNWKLIQYSAYLALFFALLHLAYIDFWSYIHYYSICVVYVLVKLIEKNYIRLPK